MGPLILLLAVVAVIYILLRRVQTMPAQKRKGEYIKLGLGIAIVAAVLLAATGRMNWIGAAFAGLLVIARQSLPLLVRFLPMLASLRTKSGAPAGGHSSTVETALLRMQLDHDSGELQGEVLKGGFKGRRLADMDRQQLGQFFAYCRSEDADSLQLLSSYLQQRFPGDTHFEGQQQESPRSGQSMGRADALAALGLKEDATRDEVIAAHRKLIQKLHPDRGGNDFLAAQINLARDVLLG